MPVPAVGAAARLAPALPNVLLLGFGDSLTHGTMDATNNSTNALNAYLQKIARSLAVVTTLTFSQPLFDVNENHPDEPQGGRGRRVFGGRDQYYKRAGTTTSYVTESYPADALLPLGFEDNHDKVFCTGGRVGSEAIRVSVIA